MSSGAKPNFGRLDYTTINGGAVAAMVKAKAAVTAIDPGLRALVELRVSQINGCAYCIDLHIREALTAGEAQQRLDCVSVWEECGFFDGREMAALAWAEAVTLIGETGAPDDLYRGLVSHYCDEEIVDLTLIIAQMNAWNRLAISFHHRPELRTK